MCGSSSTSVTRSTLACLRTSRTAMPSPPPRTRTRRGAPVRRQRRMDERLVIAVLVARVELQVAVEEEADAGRARRDDDALVGARLAVDHAVGVEAVLGPARDHVGAGEGRDQCADRQRRGGGVRGEAAQLGTKEPERPDRDGGVEKAEERAGADQPELRHEDERKGDRDGERAEVVEGQHLRNERLQPAMASAGLALEDPHDERDLEADQDADDEDQRIEREAERRRRQRLQREQRRRHQAADQADEQLDAQELRRPAGARGSATATSRRPSRTDRCR